MRVFGELLMGAGFWNGLEMNFSTSSSVEVEHRPTVLGGVLAFFFSGALLFIGAVLPFLGGVFRIAALLFSVAAVGRRAVEVEVGLEAGLAVVALTGVAAFFAASAFSVIFRGIPFCERVRREVGLGAIALVDGIYAWINAEVRRKLGGGKKEVCESLRNVFSASNVCAWKEKERLTMERASFYNEEACWN